MARAIMILFLFASTTHAGMIGGGDSGYTGYLLTAVELAPPNPYLVESSNMQWLPNRITPIDTGHAHATYRLDFGLDIDTAFLSTTMVVLATAQNDKRAFVATDISPNGTDWAEVQEWNWIAKWSPLSSFPGLFNAYLDVAGYDTEIWVRFRAYTEENAANAYFVENYVPGAIDNLHISASPVFVAEPAGLVLALSAAVAFAGCVATITKEKFPKQGRYLHERCVVGFHYDMGNTIGGQVVRDDAEEPFQSIIKLDDGRYILGTECQFQPASLKVRK